MALILAAVTLVLVAARLYAARVIGFGDSEALYATYALHPQPAYLDHPGLVGAFAASLGSGGVPTPAAAHLMTAVLASALPWLAFVVARRLGAETNHAALASLALALTPEIAVGLFAMTPDLLLAYFWLGFLGTAGLAFASEPRSLRAAALFLVAGVCIGAGATAKVSGALLLPVLLVTAAGDARHRRTPWPWLGTLVGALPPLAVLAYEARSGFPMLRHRLVDTQAQAGLSLRNLGAVVGGQLVYVSPLVLLLALWVAQALFRARRKDATTSLFFWSLALPFVPLLALCLWSRVAEPHWLAPPLLALPLFAAREGLTFGRRLVTGALALAATMTVTVYAWVLVPSLLRFAPARYDARVDISNELYGWPLATRAVTNLLDEAGPGTWLVGPSWMVCAQLQASLPRSQVGCATNIPSDFDAWAPRSTWERADAIVYVSDDRDTTDPSAALPAFFVARTSRVTLLRGGRVARTFRLSLLERRARG